MLNLVLCWESQQVEIKVLASLHSSLQVPGVNPLLGSDRCLSSVSWQCRTEGPVSWGLGSASRGWLHYLSCFLCIPPHTSNLFDLHFYLTSFTPMGESSLLLRDHVISLGLPGLSKILSPYLNVCTKSLLPCSQVPEVRRWTFWGERAFYLSQEATFLH